MYPNIEVDEEEPRRTQGKGRDVARELLGSLSRGHESRQNLFKIEDSDSDVDEN